MIRSVAASSLRHARGVPLLCPVPPSAFQIIRANVHSRAPQCESYPNVRKKTAFARTNRTTIGFCARSNTLVPAVDKQQQRSSPEALLFVDSGLSFGSANLRKERLGCSWNRHSAQQQSPSCDIASVYRTPGVIVLTERCTCQREPSERTLGTGVGQDLCIQLPIRTGLGMPSNWTRCRGSVPSNLEITRRAAFASLCHSERSLPRPPLLRRSATPSFHPKS